MSVIVMAIGTHETTRPAVIVNGFQTSMLRVVATLKIQKICWFIFHLFYHFGVGHYTVQYAQTQEIITGLHCSETHVAKNQYQGKKGADAPFSPSL